MKAKRPSLRGKGADIFLGEEPSAPPSSKKSIKNVVEVAGQIHSHEESADGRGADKEKATFYLPIEVLDQLEGVWHDLRRVTRRKIKKSDIVSIALQNAADEFKAWQSEKSESCPLIERLSDRRLAAEDF